MLMLICDYTQRSGVREGFGDILVFRIKLCVALFQVVSMNEQLYFFDNLKELTDAPKKGKKTKEREFYPDAARTALG